MASLLRSGGFLGRGFALSRWPARLVRARPIPRTLRDQLEDQLLDGDRDAEDLAALHLGRQGLPSHSGAHAYVALQGFAADIAGGRELGAFLVLQVPLDRFASPARAPVGPIPGEGMPITSDSADLRAPSVPLLSFPVAPSHAGSLSAGGRAGPQGVPGTDRSHHRRSAILRARGVANARHCR